APLAADVLYVRHARARDEPKQHVRHAKACLASLDVLREVAVDVETSTRIWRLQEGELNVPELESKLERVTPADDAQVVNERPHVRELVRRQPLGRADGAHVRNVDQRQPAQARLEVDARKPN